MTDAVVPNYNGIGVLERCLDALRDAEGVGDILVVDDGSTDDSPQVAKERGAAVLRSPGKGFSAAVNHGVAHARSELVLVLNSDAFVRRDTIELLAATLAEDPRLALVAAALVREDGARARTHGHVLTLANAIRLSLALPTKPPPERDGVQQVSFVPLACVLARTEAWREVGGLDAGYRFYFEDHDLCWRLGRAGWRVAVRWDATATHLEGGSSRAVDPQRWFPQFHASRLRYLRKRYPRAWPLYVAVFVPSALVRALVWLGRGRGRRDARRWAAAYARAAVAGWRC